MARPSNPEIAKLAEELGIALERGQRYGIDRMLTMLGKPCRKQERSLLELKGRLRNARESVLALEAQVEQAEVDLGISKGILRAVDARIEHMVHLATRRKWA